MVYASDEAGAGLDVYVRAFPDGAVAYRISESGGQQPVWARDGESVYYVPRDTVIRGGFDLPPFRGHADYDVMSDGRLVLMRPTESAQRLVVTFGWLAALRAEWAKSARP